MSVIDRDGLTLCKFQGELFKSSLNSVSSSSEIFIRRFMYSSIAVEMDSLTFLDDITTIEDVFENIEHEYGKSAYGKVKYNSEVLYWIGYLYRYFSYTYKLTSKQVYRIVKPKELNQMYYVYHTFDCAQAIERILEEKGFSFDNPNGRLLELLRKRSYEENVILKNNSPIHSECLCDDVEEDSEVCGKSLMLNECSDISLAIIYKEDIIGEIYFKNIQNDNAELCVEIADGKYRNMTFGSVAIKKALIYAKENFNLKAVYVKLMRKDEFDIRMFENSDFVYQDETDVCICFLKKL